MKKVTILSASVILVFALTGAVFFSRTITSPVKKLSDIAYKISQGDMTEQITVKSKDEIGMLARSFDTMRIKVAKLIEDMEEAKQDWESTFDSVKDIIVIYGKDCKVVRCNDVLLSRLNVELEDIMGKRCYEVFYDSAVRYKHMRECKVLETLKTLRPSLIERESKTLNGIFLLSTFPRFNNRRELVGVVQIMRDITEQKREHEQLMKSHKMASLGQLTAGVVHEVLNPLNIISAHVQLLLAEAEKGSKTEEDLRSIREEIDRIVKITDGLLRFSRKEKSISGEVEINSLLEKIISIVEPEMKLCNIKFIRRFEEGLPKIAANSDELRQVFLNMITNAKGAMPEGGSLTISTQSIKKQGNPFITIKFTDTGIGIPKKAIGEVFDPFFTTKEESKGTGLGLSISYGIIRHHGGIINVESKVGKGTTFTIDLPC